MNEIKDILLKDIMNKPERIVVSNRTDGSYEYRKLDIRNVRIKERELYQITYYTDKQAFQCNVDSDELLERISEVFPDRLKQLNVFFASYENSYKLSKGGKLLKNTNAKHKLVTKEAEHGHNRKKNYILREGMDIPPLVDMGVLTKDGKVVNSMYDKFKQINRFVELVDDIVKDINHEINIVDFGCGKSYLTFVLYYYMVHIKKIPVNITGLDLKADVIEKCNATAERYGYDRLHFQMGDIKDFTTDKRVDMVVTLHACDTATDYALYNAVMWNATYILSVPCCQHELNKQISSNKLAPMMKYGIIKERMAALATDAIRGTLLEYKGYNTQLIEFVDMAHSPKNILIRAVKSNIPKAKRQRARTDVETMCESLGVKPTLYELLCEKEREVMTRE